MRLYKLTFNEMKNYWSNVVVNKDGIQPREIVTDNGILYVAVSTFEELKLLEPYGNGIKTSEFLGGVLILEPKENEANNDL